MTEYAKKLLDPRWQKKRLEIFERDKFTFQICESTENTLHVHHRYYIWGNDPWDYPSESLVTLCDECHGQEEYLKPCATRFLNGFKDFGFNNVDFESTGISGSKLSKFHLLNLFTFLSHGLFVDELITLMSKHRRYLFDKNENENWF